MLSVPDPRVGRVLQYIDKHIHQALSLELLSSVATMSRFHFSRVFKECMGESVKAYVRRVKLEKASVDILLSEKKIKDIAKQYGFKNHATFSRAFKSYFGSSPSQQRSIKMESDSLASLLGQNNLADMGNALSSVELDCVSLKRLPRKTVHCVGTAVEKNDLLLSWMTLIKAVGQKRFAKTANQKMHVFSCGLNGANYNLQHGFAIELASGVILPNVEVRVIPASLYAVFSIRVKNNDAGWSVPIHQRRLLLERQLVHLVSRQWAQTYGLQVLNSPCFSIQSPGSVFFSSRTGECFDLFIPVGKLALNEL